MTDLGQGLELAVDLGIERGYRQQAAAVAAKSGIVFKRDTFLVQNLRRDQLAAGIAFLADAVAKSLDRARIAAAERRTNADIDRLAIRLGRIFEPKNVRKNAELQGASTHPNSPRQWGRLDDLVTTDRGPAAFDLVTPNPNSVAATTTKFHDLARLDHPPARIAPKPRPISRAKKPWATSSPSPPKPPASSRRVRTTTPGAGPRWRRDHRPRRAALPDRNMRHALDRPPRRLLRRTT